MTDPTNEELLKLCDKYLFAFKAEDGVYDLEEVMDSVCIATALKSLLTEREGMVPEPLALPVRTWDENDNWYNKEEAQAYGNGWNACRREMLLRMNAAAPKEKPE